MRDLSHAANLTAARLLPSTRSVSTPRVLFAAVPEMTNTKMLIADDHPAIVDGVTMSLEHEGIKRVGVAHEPSEVVPEYLRCKPDVVVLDVAFGSNARAGLTILTDLFKVDKGARVVIYSQYDQDELIAEAYRLGVHSFVPKHQESSVLADAIRAVSVGDGQSHYLPEIATRLAKLYARGTNSPKTKLDARELQVFTMLAQGLMNQEIADQIGLSTKTVGLIRKSVETKLDVTREAELTLLAVKHRIIEP